MHQLIDHPQRQGCRLEREGGRHTIYFNPANGAKAPVPRRAEIDNRLARKIRQRLAILAPADPDASARGLRTALGCGAVIVTDTFGRPWREGLVDVAIGVAGLEALEDYRGCTDRRGRKLSATIIAVADQLAAAAGLLMRKPDGCPAVLIRGFEWQRGPGSARALIRNPGQDLFR